MNPEGGRYAIDYGVIRFKGDYYFLPKYAAHRPAVQQVLKGAYYEPDTHELIDKIFSNISGSMVHAGTFYGDMLPSFSKVIEGLIYAFEPVLENYVLAKLCVEKNNLENVKLYNSALSNEQGNLRINTGTGGEAHRGGASFIDNKGLLCSALRIDDFTYDDLLVIQLDVEGFELNALEGAVESIEAHRPIIMIEDNNKNCEDFLVGQNYVFVKSIPGLDIWLPAEQKDEYLELVS